MVVTSVDLRSSIVISAPVGVVRSIVVRGAATTNLIFWNLARHARPYVPILFAVSPFAATRSAPTMMQEMFSDSRLRPRSAPAMESVIKVEGILSCKSS